ncbi:MAG: glycosyltransferase family 4 protein [Fibrobacterota bacterium]|nr:glycosyltransferase family 4 protein [Fibrobacterota bacterium]
MGATWRLMRKSSPTPDTLADSPPTGASDIADPASGADLFSVVDAATWNAGVSIPKPPLGRPLKILQVSHDLRAGGLQRVVIDLAQGLKRLGHDAHICSLRGSGPLEAEIRGRGIPVWAMPWPEKGADRWMFAKVFRLLKEQRYDVIHTHNTQAFLDGGLAALLARVPARVHTDHARAFPDKLRYMAMERVMSNFYGKVVGVSAHTVENLRRYEGISRKRLAVILNGIDGAWYRAERNRLEGLKGVAGLRHEAGLDGFKHVFGLGVRLEEQKGIRYLLEAMPAILARHPDCALAVAGTGSLERELRDRAVALGVEDNVRFLGAYPELTSFYPLIDFFVLPSLWEGLPLCLLEAMSLGLPIIATRVGGVGDLLEDGRSARLTPPMDAAALAEAVTGFLDRPEAAQELGRAARRDFDARYDSGVMVRQYLEMYRGCLGEGSATVS